MHSDAEHGQCNNDELAFVFRSDEWGDGGGRGGCPNLGHLVLLSEVVATPTVQFTVTILTQFACYNLCHSPNKYVNNSICIWNSISCLSRVADTVLITDVYK